MIDVNYHLITQAGHPPPADYYESSVQLGRLGVLEPEFAGRIAACAGLGNRIVHEYNDLDARKVHEALRTALQDIPVYLGRLYAYIAKS